MTFAKQMVLQRKGQKIQNASYNAASTVLLFQKLCPILVGSVINFGMKYKRVVT